MNKARNYSNRVILTLFLSIFLVFPAYETASHAEADWGFYAHRLINRMAVFTLPPELMTLYKDKVEWVSEHAVDPDKRRYATKFEAIRHYIDLDVWGALPFEHLPRDWTTAIASFAQLHWISEEGDTLRLLDQKYPSDSDFWVLQYQTYTDSFDRDEYLDIFRSDILPNYYEENWIVDPSVFSEAVDRPWTESGMIRVVDTFSQHGVLPWHLQQMYHRLVRAFRQNDTREILRLSADFGHYIGDAHVPLHTTKNYNGQLSNQVGIHAFWESRIPELFAEETYDFFVGKAKYVRDEQSYFWDMVLQSHQLVDSVLSIEKRLSEEIPEEKQYCYEERFDRTIRTQCRAYADAYRKAMSGMVERRMRKAIHAVGSIWYSAWVDAGQPQLTDDEVDLTYEILQDTLPSGPAGWKTRKHQ